MKYFTWALNMGGQQRIGSEIRDREDYLCNRREQRRKMTRNRLYELLTEGKKPTIESEPVSCRRASNYIT